MKRTQSTFASILLALGFAAVHTQAQFVPYAAIGDSIGEGVQTLESTARSQPNSYVALIAAKTGAPMPLPLIQGGFFTSVRSVDGRTRIDPYLLSPNLAVSGHTVGNALRLRADALSPQEINTEADLVLFPKLGSQVEIAEFIRPQFATVWLGANDVLGTVISFDQLDASQMTPVDTFRADFTELVNRINAAGITALYGNVGNVTFLPYLFDADALTVFTGSDQHLPPGSYTSLFAMVLLRLGLDDASLLMDPNWVLDASEIARIQARVVDFNHIIAEQTARVGAPLADINGVFEGLLHTPLVIRGVPILNTFGGGLFSLDGFHPSNVGQALVAQTFLNRANQAFGASFPTVTDADLARIFLTDPFVDKDGDGRVTGRIGAGLFETIMFLLGVSGDFFDFPVQARALRSRDSGPAWNGDLFIRAWLPSRGLAGELTDADRAFTIWLFKEVTRGFE